MIYSNVVIPDKMKQGEHFTANQFSRTAFNCLSGNVLNIDQFQMSGPTFAPHPHAGFSSVTYLLEDSEGSFINRDSLGNVLELPPGSTHWSRASKGLIHEEYPAQNGKAVRGLQIFFNLPEARQMGDAAALHIAPNEVKQRTFDNGVVYRESINGTHIAGQDALPNAAFIAEIQIPPTDSHTIPIEANFGGVIVVLDGEVEIDVNPVGANQAIAFNTTSSEAMILKGNSTKNRVVIVAGELFEQDIHQRGPFIFASRETLNASIQRFQNGQFGQIN